MNLKELASELNRALLEYPELGELPVRINVDGTEAEIDNVDRFASTGVVLEGEE